MATYAFDVSTLKYQCGKNLLKITCDINRGARAIIDVDRETRYEFKRVVKGSIVKLLHDKDNVYYAQNIDRIKFDISGPSTTLEIKGTEKCLLDVYSIVNHVYSRLAFGMIAMTNPQRLPTEDDE